MNRFYQTLTLASFGALLLIATSCTKAAPASDAGKSPRVFISAQEADAKSALAEVESEIDTQLTAETDQE